MKLAEALNLRADLQRRVEQLRMRLAQNAKVQEGEEPLEDPKGLLAELDACMSQLEELIAKINLANSRIVDENGTTLTELLARRDALALKLSVLRTFADEAGGVVMRYGKSEIKVRSTVDMPALRKEIDKYSEEWRELNTKIQGINWTEEI
ncbi:MAG TPA: DIP1984 family protein [Bacillota bacterium]|nr:DIP1984 family protein [Clostridiales bacterium]HPT85942.1 DIP1984 family protein [Bacillota bacterium]